MAERASSGWSTALFIARKDVAYALRSRVTLLWLFLMPPVFMFFIGSTTARMSGSDGPVGLEVEGHEGGGFLAEHLIQQLEEGGFALAADGDATPARRLLVPPGFTDQLLGGEPVTLAYEYQPGELTASYNLLRVQRAAYTVLADVVASGASTAPDAAAAVAELDAAPRRATLTVTTAGQRVVVPRGFDQAIPGMLVMFTLIVLLTNGANDLLVDRQRGVLRRLASVPVGRGWLVLGKWGGKMFLASIQVLFAMLMGSLLFSMDWGPNMPMVVVVLFAWAAFCASLAFLLGSVGRSEAQITGLGLGTAVILAALGGCWWPIEISPPVFQSLQMVLPSGWAMDGLHQMISFQAGPLSALPHVLALLLAALAVGWIARGRLRFT